jgi:uncharacterized protein
MTDPSIIAGNTDLDLADAPIDPSWILDGAPAARNRVLFHSSDKSAWTMVWECTAGAFRWTYHFDETVHVLDGSVAITDAQGLTKTFRQGEVIFFPAGSVAEWRIDSHVRKLAFCQNPLPAQLNIVWRLYRRATNLARRAVRLCAGLLADAGLSEPQSAQEIPLSGTFNPLGRR